MSAMRRRARSRNSAPSALSDTLRVLRTNIGTPASCSSRWMSWLKADCDRWQRSAARVKCRHSASSTKALRTRWERFIERTDQSFEITHYTEGRRAVSCRRTNEGDTRRHAMPLTPPRAATAFAAAASACAFAWSAHTDARVTRLTISVHESPTYAGQSFGSVGQFEKLIGTASGEIDPNDRRNAIIQDIQLAPRNARGIVEYVATFTLIKPIDLSKGNGGLLYQVVNRGSRGQAYNLGGDPGDGFTQGLGYAMLWSGWQGDVVPLANNANETIQVPVAKGPGGAPVTGPVLGRFSNVSGSTSQIIVYNAPIAYRPLSLDTTQAVLKRNAPETIRGEIPGGVTTIPSTDWAWADCRTVPFPGTPDPTRICLKAGFDPTQVYTLVYTGKDPLVLGVGLAATRDINSFFRHAKADDAGSPNPLAGAVKFVLSQGTSQSGNLIKTFIDLGFNEDEMGRRVWDGANPHIAARQTPINFRFANPGGDASLYSPGSEPVVLWHTYQDKARDRPPASMLDRC